MQGYQEIMFTSGETQFLKSCFEMMDSSCVSRVSSILCMSRLPFSAVRKFCEQKRATSTSATRPRHFIVKSAVDAALFAVMLAEDHPDWSVWQVTAVVKLCKEQALQIGQYVESCMFTFVSRTAARIIQKDSSVGMDDAISIAMVVLLGKVYDAAGARG